MTRPLTRSSTLRDVDEHAPLTAYLAPEGFASLLATELRDKADLIYVNDRLFVALGEPISAHWAQSVWLDARLVRIKSIGEAVKFLRRLQRNWWPYAFQLHRRTSLIQEQLPKVRYEAHGFPAAATELPPQPLGAYCLLDEETLLVAPRTTSPFPNGEPSFIERRDASGPPSRAYLKLYEALTLMNRRPEPGERCLELGASPGGWTWVVAGLGAEILAFDRAPLAPHVAAMPGVVFHEGDAFGAKPDVIGPIDWLVSDVICYPEKLYDFVRLWLDSGRCRRFVCTLKFQGDAHYGIIPAFAAIPGGRLVHLASNKHELTWLCDVGANP